MDTINQTEIKMNKVVEHLIGELGKIRTGRANPSILDGVHVLAYGNKVAINTIAMISVPEARQLLVKPFDPSTIKDIEKGILESNLGFNPTNDGQTLRITIPQLTEELRKKISKDIKGIGENSKVSIRSVRKEAIDKIKKDNEVSTDMQKQLEKDIQKVTDSFNGKIIKIISEKEKEIMTI